MRPTATCSAFLYLWATVIPGRMALLDATLRNGPSVVESSAGCVVSKHSARCGQALSAIGGLFGGELFARPRLVGESQPNLSCVAPTGAAAPKLEAS